jgi:hypothetical protein
MDDEISNRSYDGMTVNERLWESGLMNEFDHVKKSNKQRAIEILLQLGVDKPSIYKILGIKINIPTERLIQAFCNYYSINVLKELEDFNISWVYKRRIRNKKSVDRFFAFSTMELLSFLESYPAFSDKVINESYDKRSSPSTFIREKENEFEVGVYDKGFNEVQIWNDKYKAVADYLLLSWNLPRMKK